MANKHYEYKVYKAGVYAGNIPKVTSEFTYSQDVNTAGAELNIEIGATLETAGATLTRDIVVDENGFYITDEGGNPIYASEVYSFATIPVDVGSRVDVWMSDANNLSGAIVFTGQIISWEFDYIRSSIVVRVQSFGVFLDQYIIGAPAYSVVTSNATTNQETTVYPIIGRTSGQISKVYQTFTVPLPTVLGSVKIKGRVTLPVLIEADVYAGNPLTGGTLLETFLAIFSNTTSQDLVFNYSLNKPLTPGVTYYIAAYPLVGTTAANPVYFSSNSTDVYASGQMYTATDGGGNISAAPQDLYFSVYAGNITSLTATFNSYDPGNIARILASSFNLLNSGVTSDTASIDLTGTTVSYMFSSNTYLEGIKKCLELAPGGWYWYLDASTGKIHLHRKSVSPDHTFVIGQHIKGLSISQTLDNMKNIVYYSGSTSGGTTNLLTINSDAGSVAAYGQWLDRQSDGRVTSTSTANTISSGILTDSSRPSFRTTVSILAIQYDIESIKLGQMVQFRSGNSITTGLMLQIVGFTRFPDYVELRLDSFLPTVAHRIEDIERNLTLLQTNANPTTL